MSSTLSKSAIDLSEFINTFGVDSSGVSDTDQITTIFHPGFDGTAQIQSMDTVPGSMTLFIPLRQPCDLATISIGSHSSINVRNNPDEIVVFSHTADSLAHTLSPQDLVSPDTLRHNGLPSQRIAMACSQCNQTVRYRLEPRKFRGVSAITVHVERSVTGKDHTILNHVALHGKPSAPIFSHPNVTVVTSQIRPQPRLAPVSAPH
ncbi:hypothetical protein OC845_005418 [Tilletia horrida]|nr:hypothetical protein OC845_005418 [Tilletia horrida]